MTKYFANEINTTLVAIYGLLLILSSCDCVVNHVGYVFDSNTEKPIPNAIVKFNKKEYKTDSLGYFEINYITGTCPEGNFEIVSNNHQTENIIVKQEDDEIIYRVQETNKDGERKSTKNSLNFKVKNDTITFYLN